MVEVLSITHIALEKNRIHKFLEDTNIKQPPVVKNMSVATVAIITDAMIEGEGKTKKLVKL